MKLNHPGSALSRSSSCIYQVALKSREGGPLVSSVVSSMRTNDSPAPQLKSISSAQVDGTPAQPYTHTAFPCLLFTKSSLLAATREFSAAAFPSVLWDKSTSLCDENQTTDILK